MHDDDHAKEKAHISIAIHKFVGISHYQCPAGYYEMWEICLVYPISPLLYIKCHHVITSFSFSSSIPIYFFVSFLVGTLMSSSNMDPSGSHINNGTLPLRSSAYSCPNSTQLTTTMSTIDRPHSNSSNVYQTIDADRFATSVLSFSFFNKYVWCSLFEQT
jgi:hypothetical protein